MDTIQDNQASALVAFDEPFAPSSAPASLSRYSDAPRLPRDRVYVVARRIGETQARFMRIAVGDRGVVEAAIAELAVANKARRIDPVVTGGSSPKEEARLREIWQRLTAPPNREAFQRAYRRLTRQAHRGRWNPLMTLAFYRAIDAASEPRRVRAARCAYAQWRDAVNRLVESNTGLAIHTVERYPEHGLPREDRQQAAMMGLMRAAERYVPGARRAFSTYAVPWIRGTNTHERRTAGDLTQIAEHGSACTGLRFWALDDDTVTTSREIEDEQSQPLKTLAQAHDIAAVRDAWQALAGQQRYVVGRLYGMDGAAPDNYQSLARRMGLGRAQVQTMADRGLQALGEMLTPQRS